MNFSLNLTYHEVYHQCSNVKKRSLLCDQTIEDIIIFSSAFLVEPSGVAQLTHSPLHIKVIQCSGNGP